MVGRRDEARPILERVRRHERARADEPWAARLNFALGRVLAESGDWPAAEVCFRASLATRRRREPKQWTTFATAALLGQSLAAQGKPDEAGAYLTDGYRGLADRLATVPLRYKHLAADAADDLARRSLARGDEAGAARWRAERAKYPPESAPAPRERPAAAP